MMDQTTDLAEVLHVVHFDAPLAINALDFAGFVGLFSDDFPSYQEAQASPVVALDSIVPPEFLEPSLTATWPRAVLRSKDGQDVITFQTDRIAFGWERTRPIGEIVIYPGYEKISERFLGILQKFDRWCASLNCPAPKVRLIEIAYHNGAVLVEGGVQKRKTSDIIRFMQPMNMRINHFQIAWSHNVTDDPAGGRLNASAVIRTSAPDLVVLAYTFAGLLPVASDLTGVGLPQALHRLHADLLDMHATTII